MRDFDGARVNVSGVMRTHGIDAAHPFETRFATVGLIARAFRLGVAHALFL